MSTKILAIGAATQDIFLSGKALVAKRDVRTHDYIEQFPLGAKIELDDAYFDSGGGATNAAVTFARQGLGASFIGKVGHDTAGANIVRGLTKEGVATEHVAIDSKLATGVSVLLMAPGGERTVLVYRGASQDLNASDFPIRNLTGDWMYITSLAGNFDLLKRFLKQALARQMRVALNPGSQELAKPRKLLSLLPMVDVLIVNIQEASALFGNKDTTELLQSITHYCRYGLLTDAANGSFATDSTHSYQAGQYHKVKIVDRTGAGDAFGAGFIAGLAKDMAIEDALTLASANATSVVTKVGAKAGILRTKQLKRMKIKVSQL